MSYELPETNLYVINYNGVNYPFVLEAHDIDNVNIIFPSSIYKLHIHWIERGMNTGRFKNFSLDFNHPESTEVSLNVGTYYWYACLAIINEHIVGNWTFIFKDSTVTYIFENADEAVKFKLLVEPHEWRWRWGDE